MPALSAVRRLLRGDFVRHGGSVIPAQHLRRGGIHFQDDDAFVASAEAEARRAGGLGNRILEIGCGPGRLAIGLKRVGNPELYVGVDVDEPSIRWCNRHLADGTYRFQQLDVANERYNPSGKTLDETWRLPFGDASFDAVYQYSVFSHMRGADVALYLRELRRVLDGRMFFTAFVEDGVPSEEVNPPGYRMQWRGALHCVRFARDGFDEMLRDAGFQVDLFDYAAETDGQSGYYVS